MMLAGMHPDAHCHSVLEQSRSVRVTCSPWLSSALFLWQSRSRRWWRTVCLSMKIYFFVWIFNLIWSLLVIYSQSDAFCQSNGPDGVWRRPDLSAALHPAGGTVGSGKLGCEEVSLNQVGKKVHSRGVQCAKTSFFCPQRCSVSKEYLQRSQRRSCWGALSRQRLCGECPSVGMDCLYMIQLFKKCYFCIP